jgi:hypothetical protein
LPTLPTLQLQIYCGEELFGFLQLKSMKANKRKVNNIFIDLIVLCQQMYRIRGRGLNGFSTLIFVVWKYSLFKNGKAPRSALNY